MRVLKGREHFECAKNDIIREEYLKVKEAAKFNPMDEKKLISVFSVVKTNQAGFPFSIPSFLSLILFYSSNYVNVPAKECAWMYIYFFNHNYYIKNDKNDLY